MRNYNNRKTPSLFPAAVIPRSTAITSNSPHAKERLSVGPEKRGLTPTDANQAAINTTTNTCLE